MMLQGEEQSGGAVIKAPCVMCGDDFEASGISHHHLFRDVPCRTQESTRSEAT